MRFSANPLRVAIDLAEMTGRPQARTVARPAGLLTGPQTRPMTRLMRDTRLDSSEVVPPAGLEPAISCVKGRRPNR
jgi:hypothetical protein